MDKLKELGRGEQLMGGAGILLLLLSFFTWFSKDYPGASVSGVRIGGGTYNGHNGLGGIISLLGILITVAAVVLVVLARFTSVKLPENLGNMPMLKAIGIGGIVGGALCVLQILIGQSVHGTSLDRTIWAWIALLAAAGVAAGGGMMLAGLGAAPEAPEPPAV